MKEKRLFIDWEGHEVDYLPNTIKELDELMFSRIGYALVYLKYYYPNWDDKQEWRIHNLIKNFADNRKEFRYLRPSKNLENILWFKEQIYIFEDETENMC